MTGRVRHPCVKRKTRPPTERFLLLVERRAQDECWPWTGYVAPKTGYGYFRNVKNRRPHQFAYELWVGPIPAGYEVDHRCHDPRACSLLERCPHRRCVNPTHLEAVPPKVNLQRALQRDHCSNGHHRDSEHFQTRQDGRRYCRTCSRDRARKQRAAIITTRTTA